MNQLIHFFIENKKFTFVLTLFVLFFGLSGLKRLNSESFPAVDFAMATIVTAYDGASAEDIETKITKPIEDEIRSVAGLKDVRSISQAGLSTINVRGDIDNANVPRMMADLQRAVDRAKMPADLEDPPEFTEIKSEEFPVVEIAIVGSNLHRARDIAADLLKDEIEDDKNILGVRPTSFRERQFEIHLDRAKLESHHIGVNEVIGAIERRNINVPGGHLKQKKFQQLLRIEGKVRNAEDIANILIRSNASGQAIFLKDIATIDDGMEEAKTLSRYNGREATLRVANKKAGADTIELVKNIDRKIENFREKYKGQLEFYIYNNEALKVKNRVAVLASNALSGLALVIFFLLIFLPGRIGIVASLSLPIAVLATVGFMPTFGMNLDAVTILALVIAIGMLVDNSVVISENYTRLLGDGLSPRDAILSSLQTLWLPITATAFTTIAAFLPMLVTTGIMGEFIRFIPIIVSLSLIASLGESFFFLPMRLEGISSQAKEVKADWFQRNFIPRFESFMRICIRRRYLTLVAFTMVFLGSLLMMTVGNQFMLFPPDQTEIYAARLEMPKGSRLEETDKEMEWVSQEIHKKIKTHVNHIVSRSGVSTLGPDDPKAKESQDVGIIFIYVNENARDNVPYTEILAELRKIKAPHADVQFEALINGPPVGAAVSATLRSNNSESLNTVVDSIVSKLKSTEGLLDVAVQDTLGDDEVFVEIDYKKADQLGLDVDSVGKAIRAAVSGKVISDVNLNNKEVELFLQLKAENRKDVADLGNLKVLGRDGHLIPLKAFAQFRRSQGQPQIKRFDYRRSRTITANIEGEVITSPQANQIVQETFNELNKEYKDVSLVFGGEAESTNESMASLFNALVLSLIGIFALLVFLFNSFLRPAIIMSTIPLGLVGFSVAFAFHQRPISFLAMIGIIGLGGIIVNSGIVLITFIDQLRAESQLTLDEILAKASGLRLRAVVVSSLTTISGLFPTAYGWGGSDAILIPMTLAMAWGLTSGTILTLVWVPCAYALLEDLTRFTQKVSNAVFRRKPSNPNSPLNAESLS